VKNVANNIPKIISRFSKLINIKKFEKSSKKYVKHRIIAVKNYYFYEITKH